MVDMAGAALSPGISSPSKEEALLRDLVVRNVSVCVCVPDAALLVVRAITNVV